MTRSLTRFRKTKAYKQRAAEINRALQGIDLPRLARLGSVPIFTREELLGTKSAQDLVAASRRVAEMERARRSPAPPEDPSRLFKVLSGD
jgi:hypothetical protein